MTRKTHAACFVVTGEYLTQQARSFVLEDEPGRAYRLLSALDGEGSEGVIGPILRGEMKLTGDSSEGITTEEDDDHEYRERVAQLYAGRFRRSGKWYRPCGVVRSRAPSGSPAQARWALQRAQEYTPLGGFVARVGDDAYLFESCSEPPHWSKACVTEKEAVANCIALGWDIPEVYESTRTLCAHNQARIAVREKGLDSDEADKLFALANAADDERREQLCADIRQNVREQAGDDVFELRVGARVLTIPRAPFERWAIARARLDVELPAWEVVSKSGMKLQLDDPCHTDWLLGAGLELADAYDKELQEACSAELLRLQFAAMDAQEASETHD